MNRRQSRHRGMYPFLALSLLVGLWMLCVMWQLDASTRSRSSSATATIGTPRESRESGRRPNLSVNRTHETLWKSMPDSARESSSSPSSSSPIGTRRADQEQQLVIFSTLKPCPANDEIRYAQLDAVTTWLSLLTRPTVALLGSGGSGECASWIRTALLLSQKTKDEDVETRVVLIPEARQGPHGTVLLGAAFRLVESRFPRATAFGFVNGDILLHPASSFAVAEVAGQFTNFFMIGHRMIVNIPLRLRQSFASRQQQQTSTSMGGSNTSIGQSDEEQSSSGLSFRSTFQWASHPIFIRSLQQQDRTDAEDLFFWSRGFFSKAKIQVPDFHIGRPAYDNWLVHAAIHSWMPVIDATDVLIAYHQQHNYDHLREKGESSEKQKSYWGGAEQEENYALGIDNGGWQHGLIDFAPLRFGPQNFCREEVLLWSTIDGRDDAKNHQLLAGRIQPSNFSCRVIIKGEWKPFSENSFSSNKKDIVQNYATFCRSRSVCALQA